jgi:hypothetical protein
MEQQYYFPHVVNLQPASCTSHQQCLLTHGLPVSHSQKAAKGFKAFFADTKEAIEVEGLEDQLSALQMIQSESVMFRERTAAAERNTARQKAEAKNLKATATKSAVPATAKVSQPAGKTLPTKKKKKKKAKANKVQVTA